MKTALRSLVAAALLAPVLAPAQTTTTTVLGVPPSLQVMRLAPQLVTFMGSQANFDSLVNGLALGAPVTLTTSLPNGQIQLVTFTPQGTMTAQQIAQTLETGRQSLISRGVAAPTAQQVATTLTGGLLPTQTGAVQVNALLPSNNLPVATAPSATGGTSTVTTSTAQPNGNPSPAALLQGQSSAGGTTPPSPAQIIQNQRGSNISDTPTTGNTSNTPSATSTTTNGTTSANGTGTGTTTPAPATAPLAPAPAAAGASPFAAPAAAR
ncbi:MAG TPA: hypothetical protein VM140_04680 [Burkholderiales bacterium]|nr:hypothetical protein [Burkholderiales bacterium]